MSLVNHDKERGKRTGVPEVVLSEPKSANELMMALSSALEKNGNVLVSRVLDNQIDIVEQVAEKYNKKIDWDSYKRTVIVYDNQVKYHYDIDVAVLSAGTSDNKIVAEIQYTLKFLGIRSKQFVDIGVAGIHRHKTVMQEIRTTNEAFIDTNQGLFYACIIVVAGQDGALFPVITGQTDLPVIAVPSPVGYGYAGKGEAALMSALQSCSPGLAVVNIDNGFGAASLAAKIVKQMDRVRKRTPTEIQN